jgi:hypothetical protein
MGSMVFLIGNLACFLCVLDSDMDVSGDLGSKQNRQKMDFNHVVSQLSHSSVQPGENATGEHSVIIGLCLSRRNNDMGHPDTVSRQTAFEFNALQDRGYKYVSDTDEHGWRAGGGEPGCAYKVNDDGASDNSAASVGADKIPSPDTAYLPIIQIDAQSEQQVDLIVHALAKGEVFIPHMGILPESLGVNGTSPPDLVVKFGCERNEDVPPEEWPNWCIEFLHNQLYDYFQPLGAKWSKRPFQLTLAKKVRWKTVKHMNKYFSQCEGVIDSWRDQGPQFLSPDAGFIEGGATTEEVAKPHGVYLIRNGAPVNYFAPNYEPPYNSKMARSLLHNVIGKSWDKESRDWHSEPSMKLTANALLSKVCGCQEPNVLMFEEKRVAHFSTHHKTTIHAADTTNTRRTAQSRGGEVTQGSFVQTTESYDVPTSHTSWSATERLSSVQMDEQSIYSMTSAQSRTSRASCQSRSSRRSLKDDENISISTSRSKSIFEEEEEQSAESESDEESAAESEEASVESSSSEEEESEANTDVNTVDNESKPGTMLEMEEEVGEDDEENERDEEVEDEDEGSNQDESYASQSESGYTEASGQNSTASVREQRAVLEQKLLARAEQEEAAKKEKLLAEQAELERKKKLGEQKVREEQERQQRLLEQKVREEQERQQRLLEQKVREEQERQLMLLEQKAREEQERHQRLLEQIAREEKLAQEEARIAEERQKLEERLEEQRAKDQSQALVAAKEKKKEEVFRQFPSSHSALNHNNTPAMSELTTGSSFASLQQHRSDSKIERKKSSDSSTVEGAYADMFDMRRKRSEDDDSTIGGAYAGMFDIAEADDDRSSVASAYAGLYGFGQTGKKDSASDSAAKQIKHTEDGTSVHSEKDTPILSNRKAVSSPTRSAAPSAAHSAYSLSSVKKKAIEEEVRKAIQKARRTTTPDRLSRRRSVKGTTSGHDDKSISSQSTKSSAVQSRQHRSEQGPKASTSVPSAICEDSPARSVVSALSRGTHFTAQTEHSARDDASAASLVSTKSNSTSLSSKRGGTTASRSSHLSARSKDLSTSSSKHRNGSNVGRLKEVMDKEQKNVKEAPSTQDWSPFDDNSSAKTLESQFKDSSSFAMGKSEKSGNISSLGGVSGESNKLSVQTGGSGGSNKLSVQTNFDQGFGSLSFGETAPENQEGKENAIQTKPKSSLADKAIQKVLESRIPEQFKMGESTFQMEDAFDPDKVTPLLSNKAGDAAHESRQKRRERRGGKPVANYGAQMDKVRSNCTVCSTCLLTLRIAKGLTISVFLPFFNNKIHDQTTDKSSRRGKNASHCGVNSPQNSLAYSVDDSTVCSGMEHPTPSLLGCVTRSDDCSTTRSTKRSSSRDNSNAKVTAYDKATTHVGLHMAILPSASSTSDMDMAPSDEELFAIGWAKALDASSGVHYYFTLDRSKTVWENPLVSI